MDFEKIALEYHEREPAGKIQTKLSKSLITQEDLSLAYSPGVAGPCRAIAKETQESYRYTNRGNLFGVVSNGSAVLGLGNIGAAASKPVMEGKAMLFKKFANIDVFDIEINADDPDAFIAAVKALEPTFGGINLEDIKAPECFYIEERLQEEMSIPVFHDDQHGTAIIAAAAFLNALELTNRKIEETKMVFSGGGAAAVACAHLMIELGVQSENLLMCDSKGVLHSDRDPGNQYKAKFVRDTPHRTLGDALVGADVFIGVSAKGVLKGEMIKSMNPHPIIFALANPDPEIHPDEALKVRPDAIMATGRSDYPNPVNNVLGFPFIFRGALDVQAKRISREMKMAAVRAIASLAKEDVPEEVQRIYQRTKKYRFGKDYLIPKPVDPRVLMRVAPAVAQAAIESGVAQKQISISAYQEQVESILGPTKKIIGTFRHRISQVYHQSQKQPVVVLPHGHDPRIIKACSQLHGESHIDMILLGDPSHLNAVAIKQGIDDLEDRVTIMNPLSHQDAETYAEQLFRLRKRKGISRSGAHEAMRHHNYFAAMMLKSGMAQGVVTGLVEPYRVSVRPYLEIIGADENETVMGVQVIVINKKMYFFADGTINIDPSPNQLADIAQIAARTAKNLTREPIRVAFLSFSSFGSNGHPKAKRIAQAVEILRSRPTDFAFDGEMQADVALDEKLQNRDFPFNDLQGQANVLIFPDLTSANIAYKMVGYLTGANCLGPILVGLRAPVHILELGASVEDTINMIYLTANETIGRKKMVENMR